MTALPETSREWIPYVAIMDQIKKLNACEEELTGNESLSVELMDIYSE
jgi:hypothetical protein